MDTAEQRKEEFVKEYGELVQKHKVDWMSYPVFTPDGAGGFKILVQTVPMDVEARMAKVVEVEEVDVFPTKEDDKTS